MLRDTQAFSGFSVDDLEAAKRFYGETLGLEVTDGDGNLSIALPGGGTLFLYPKPDHQPATFTVLNFRSTAFDADRAQLVNAGVEFERYDMPDLKTDPDGVMRGQGPEIAWFKDPAGNVLSLIKA
jgi:catechol 2,3-dioxygenase-like lactoylglutathione lyase family enzyme